MSIKHKTAELLLSADGYISGQELAKALGVSRNAVWKSIEALRAEGYDIEATTNKGYILRSAPDIISESAVRGFLDGTDSRELIVLKSVDSTNNYAKELAKQGKPHGTAVIADTQTAGRGRMGRSFCSPPGKSVYMSVILRPDTDLQTSQLITSCAAAAAANAIDRVCGTSVQIKWVNDLFLGGRKICGILTEAELSFEEGRLGFAVVGLGINVRTVKDVFTSELLQKATSIEDETGKVFDRNEIAAAVLTDLDRYIENISSGEFMEEYRRRSFIVGKRVAVTKNGRERTAVAISIADDAGLVVEYPDKSRETLSSGEARIIV